jgi:hypothetical protein
MGKRIILTIILLSVSTAGFAQKTKKKKPAPQGTPVLWREPTDIESRVGRHGQDCLPRKPEHNHQHQPVER